MNIKHFMTCVAVGAMTLASESSFAADVANADSGMNMYVSVFAGGSLPNEIHLQTAALGFVGHHEFNTGYLLGGAFGAQVNDYLRAEVEVSHSSWQSKSTVAVYDSTGAFLSNVPVDGDMSATFALANAWFDVANASAFTPYVGGGVGAGFVDGDMKLNGGPQGIGSGNKAALAYQIGAGVKFDWSENVSFDLGYRYKNVLDTEFDNLVSGLVKFDNGNLRTHNVQLGATYKF
jgi:opacity protein-like surface antigen